MHPYEVVRATKMARGSLPPSFCSRAPLEEHDASQEEEKADASEEEDEEADASEEDEDEEADASEA